MRFFCKLLIIILLISGVSYAKRNLSDGLVMRADEIYYDAKKDSVRAKGNIFIAMDGYSLNAEEIYYDLGRDVVFAEGNVQITDDDGKIIYGERAVFKDKLKRGVIEEFVFKFDKGTIIASRLANRLNKNRASLEKAVFTPCDISCGKTPIWQVNAGHTEVDQDKQDITYKNLFFEVYNVPIIYLPYLSHPLPGAKARSGVLIPVVRHDDFVIPFYFRPKPNLDFTISPRVTRKYTIFEVELRHKVESGDYKVTGSYGNPAFKKPTRADQMMGETSPGRFHIFASGGFSNDQINYGFDFNRASDKAYLTNYHEIYDSYLASKLYANKIDGRDYFSLEGYHFQDLRIGGDIPDTPLVMPSINTLNVFSLNQDESLLVNVRSNTIAYKEMNRIQVARGSVDAELQSNAIFDNGHIFSSAISNRSDLYFVDIESKLNPNENGSVMIRHIPEFKTRWRYPVAKQISEKSSIALEPTAMFVQGRDYRARFEKFSSRLGEQGLVDAPKTELSEDNIFKSNRYSGIDFHDYGSRFSYGLNSYLLSHYFYFDAFLGQATSNNNIPKQGNLDYVGSFSLDLADRVSLFYRFRRDKKFRSVRDELAMRARSEDVEANVSFTELNNISKYFARQGFEPKENKISQVKFDTKYQLVKNLWVGGGATIDLSSSKSKLLTRTIKMTYLYDCVSIGASVSDNFLNDPSRDIRKTRNKSFSIGLKVINM